MARLQWRFTISTIRRYAVYSSCHAWCATPNKPCNNHTLPRLPAYHSLLSCRTAFTARVGRPYVLDILQRNMPTACSCARAQHSRLRRCTTHASMHDAWMNGQCGSGVMPSHTLSHKYNVLPANTALSFCPAALLPCRPRTHWHWLVLGSAESHGCNCLTCLGLPRT